jgi:hypothetical protein
MRSVARGPARAWHGLTFVALFDCGWDHLDAIGGPVTSAAVDAAVLDTGSVDADAAPTDAMLPAEAEGGAACNAASSPLKQWTFNSTTEGWALTNDRGVQANLGWTGSAGNPMPGALRVDVTPNADDGGALTGAWAYYDMSSADLSNRTVSAWVWLDSGPSPHFKVYVQTGTQYVWADGGTVYLAAHAWSCVSLNVSSPLYNQGGYDPTNAIRLGFEMLGSAPFRVYIDTVNVQ